ncbi:MAG: VWA domain-containing protein [Acidobacteriota bacterium]|nr:VWA domain-containing protein [Acidobacteriota bacterium]
MHRSPKPHYLLAALLLALPVSLAAQETKPPAFRDVVDVDEVLLDVLVTDRDGNVILGLQPEDFAVEDGDRSVAAESATFYSNRAFLESAALANRLGVSPDDVPVDRYFILFFDDPRSLFPGLIAEQLDALRWARRWVHQELLPNDWVAVVSYSYELKIHQDFTRDNEAILEALDNVAKGGTDPGNWPSRIDASEGPSLRANLPRGEELRKSSLKIYSALQTLAEASRYIVGRKNVLMFSMGFGEPGDFSSPESTVSVGRTNWGTYRPDERYYPPMMEALNDANVAVYTISLLKNLRNENAAQGILGNSLSLLADDTGGRYYFNFVTFRDPLRSAVQDNNGYYLLSYRAEHAPGTAGYRQVTVTTRNPDFVVRARKGYRYGG